MDDKKIKNADEFVQRIIKAVEREEAFLINAVFLSDDTPNAVFLAGKHPVDKVTNLFEINHRNIMKFLNSLPKKPVGPTYEKAEDGSIKITFTKK